MRHRKLPRVQHRPPFIALPVQPVAGQRMPDRCQINADLMRASGEQIDSDERAARRGAKRRDDGDGTLAAIAYAERDWTDTDERCIDGLPLTELAFADRDVAFADPLLLELPRQVCID